MASVRKARVSWAVPSLWLRNRSSDAQTLSISGLEKAGWLDAAPSPPLHPCLTFTCALIQYLRLHLRPRHGPTPATRLPPAAAAASGGRAQLAA